MKIIHKYVLAESGAPYAIGLVTFTLVVLLHRLARLSDLVIAKGVPILLVAKLLLSLFPTFLEITLPAALLLAVLLALGRLSADSETTAMQAAGVGMRGLAFPIILLSGATFLASLFIGWSGIPWGTRQLQDTLARIISIRAGAGASEHVFQEVVPGVLLFPDRVSADGSKMTGVLLSQSVPGKNPLLVLAGEGEFFPVSEAHIIRLRLSDGTIHHEETSSDIYRMASFRSMDFLLPTGAAVTVDRDDPRALTIPELFRKSGGASSSQRTASYRYHFHRRLSLAFSCLAFGLFAMPLGLLRRARGKSPAFAITVALIIFYYLFLAAGGALESRAPAGMIILIWMPNALVLGFALWALGRSEKAMLSLPVSLGRAPGRK